MDTAPSKGFISKMFSRRKATDDDIELPAEKKRDKRLPQKSKFGQIRDGYKMFKNLGKEKD